MMLMCMVVTITAWAQTAITGTVVSATDNEPIIGASVKVKGATQGTVTDVNGKFTINAKPGEPLVFSYIGMKTKQAAAKNGMFIQISTDEKMLDEGVVTALGMTKSQKTIGYAAANLKEGDLKAVPVSNVTEALAGKVAGVSEHITDRPWRQHISQYP